MSKSNTSPELSKQKGKNFTLVFGQDYYPYNESLPIEDSDAIIKTEYLTKEELTRRYGDQLPAVEEKETPYADKLREGKIKILPSEDAPGSRRSLAPKKSKRQRAAKFNKRRRHR